MFVRHFLSKISADKSSHACIGNWSRPCGALGDGGLSGILGLRHHVELIGPPGVRRPGHPIVLFIRGDCLLLIYWYDGT